VIKYNYIIKFTLFLTVISFFLPLKVGGNFSYFDLMVLVSLFILSLKYSLKIIKKEIINFILILNLFTFIGYISLLFPGIYNNNTTLAPIIYTLQFNFAFMVLPIFIFILYKSGYFGYFIKMYMYVFLLFTFLYIIFIYLFFTAEKESWLIFSTFAGSRRFIFGYGNPNDIHTYTFLAIFAYTYLNKLNNLKLFYTIIIGLTTLSKSVFLATFFYLLKDHKLKFGLLLALLIPTYIYIQDNIFFVFFERLLDPEQYSTNSSSAGFERIVMFMNAFIYALENPFRPLLFMNDNIPNEYYNVITSTHNIFGSIAANFALSGLFVFMIVLGYFSVKIIKFYKINRYKYAVLFLVMAFIVMQFQPFQNSRIFWFPIIIYLMFSLNLLKDK